MIYNNTEFYVQDNWKVSNRLTLDYGLRFTRQQPQYDQFQQMSNFFPEQWTASARAGRSTSPAAATARRVRQPNAMDPRTGQILTAPGAANTAAAIGTPSRAPAILTTASAGPATASPRPLHLADPGARSRASAWPTTSPATRPWSCAAAAVSSTTVRTATRCSAIPSNPPFSTAQDLRNGQLADPRRGLSFLPVPALISLPVRRRGAGLRGSGRPASRWRCRGRGAGRLVCRQPRLQPVSALPERHRRPT